MAQPVVLDTDIGTDIDDAYALVLAATSPELDLRAVTTVNNDVQTRARIAVALLKAMDRCDVPVAAGARDSLTPGETRGWGGHEGRGIDLAPAAGRAGIAPRDAADLIADLAREAHAAGTPLTLFAVGAMTNAAIAIRRHPDEMRLLAGIVAMASSFEGYGSDAARPEHNVACDPIALSEVLAFGVPLTLVGLNVTMQTWMTREQVEQIACIGGPLADGLTGMHRIWLDVIHSDRSAMHDGLAVAAVVQPDVVRLTPVRTRVLLNAKEPGAVEYNSAGPDEVTRAATWVDADAYHRLLWERVTAAAQRSRRAAAGSPSGT